MADSEHVGADLVGASGLELDAQQRAAGELLDDLEMGHGAARLIGAGRHDGAVAAVAPDRSVDTAAARAWATGDERQVLALDLALADRLLQRGVDGLGAGEHEQAGGVAVEAVDDARALWLGSSSELAGEELDQRALGDAGSGVHDHSR